MGFASAFAFPPHLRETSCVKSEFTAAITGSQSAFGLDLGPEAIGRLAKFYEIVRESNDLLHLVAPCSAEEFAIRHILESLSLLAYLPANAKFADVGTGAGLPAIPCLLARDDLSGVLIESKEKKARFLAEAVGRLGIRERAAIINRQFEETDAGECSFVTCRALDKFTQKLPKLMRWAGRRRMLLFGGESLAAELTRRHVRFEKVLLPLSERRFFYAAGGDPAK